MKYWPPFRENEDALYPISSGDKVGVEVVHMI